MGVHQRSSLQSKEEQTEDLESVFITNFLDGCTAQIASPWGEIVELGDSDPQSLSKEDQEVYSSDDDELQENDVSKKEGDKENIDISDVERVLESSFSHANDLVYENSSNKNAGTGNSHSEDPFNICCLLNDQHKKASKSNTIEPEYPSGFTPVTDIGANPDAASLNGVNDQIHSLSNKLKERNSKDKVSSQNTMKGGSILDVMDELVKMNFLSLNVQGLGNKTKKGWIRELCQKHIINFVSIQETKMESIDLFSIKSLWGNLNFDHVVGPSVGFSGEPSERRDLWCYLCSLIDRWDGETVVMGDFNEVRYEHKRFGSIFNSHGAKAFNNFISLAGLIDIPLEAMNIIKPNGLIRMKKKLQLLKSAIKVWSKEARSRTKEKKTIIHHKLSEVDKIIDQGMRNDDVIYIRTNLLNEIQELNSLDAAEISQKAMIRWSIEGDENTKYFHGILNKKRSQLAICGTLVNGDWISNPDGVKLTPSDIHYIPLLPRFGGVTDWYQSQVVMSSASSAVTYTAVYTDSEPVRVFWGAKDEEISEGGIPWVIVLGYDRLPIQPVAPSSPDYTHGW
ncbi:RNA-directed DNA polymerase, eukaryota [Tanacetum coccineum]